MSRPWQFRSVRTRQAFWFLVVSLGPLLLVATVLYFQRAAALRVDEIDKLETIRDLKVREIEGWLDEREGDVAVVAGDLEVRGLAGLAGRARDSWSDEERARVEGVRGLLARYVEHYAVYAEVCLVDAASGAVVVSSDPSRDGLVEPSRALLAGPLQSGEPYIGDVHVEPGRDEPTMVLAGPVRGPGGGAPFGVVAMRVDLRRSLFPKMMDYTGLGTTGETLLVDRERVAINELRWPPHAPLQLQIDAEPAVRAAAGETGIVEAEDYRGEPVLAAFTHVERTGWGFVAKRDRAEVYAPIRAMLRDLAAVVGASALAVLLLALLLGRVVARPIVAMAEVAERIRGGDLEARCEVAGDDEVAHLGRALDDMTGTVRSELIVREAVAEVAATAAAAQHVDELAGDLVAVLARVTGAPVAAWYRRDDSGRKLRLLTALGLRADAPAEFDAAHHEGELGVALARRAVCYTRALPDDSAFTFKAVAGTVLPRELATVPLSVDGRTEAVISLASPAGFEPEHRQVLEQTRVPLQTALSSLLAAERVARLAGELQAANESLQATNEELASQAEELRVQAEELVAQRAQVEQADRLKSEFLANMSHELRTPLNSMLALTQLMATRGPGTDPAQEAEYLGVIERNGRQLLALINDLLDLSKIEAGQQEVALGEVEPAAAARAAVDTVEPLAAEKGLALELAVADDAPTLRSDRAKVRRILLNLLSNAVKFTEAGRVELRVAPAGDGVAFAVRDTGPGIAEADRELVFDAFRQVDGSATRRHGGTGLGLAISRRLARLLGGDLTVDSEVGRGSTFTLTLPGRYPEDRSEAAVVRERTTPPRGSLAVPAQPRVLVVEDDPIAAIQIRSVLEEQGCEVAVAVGGERGVAAVRAAVPDLMVLDLMMPGLDGFGVLERIRSIPAAEALPVLVLTARELTAGDRARLRHNHVHELIQKGSLDRDQLVARVAALLARTGGDRDSS